MWRYRHWDGIIIRSFQGAGMLLFFAFFVSVMTCGDCDAASRRRINTYYIPGTSTDTCCFVTTRLRPMITSWMSPPCSFVVRAFYHFYHSFWPEINTNIHIIIVFFRLKPEAKLGLFFNQKRRRGSHNSSRRNRTSTREWGVRHGEIGVKKQSLF